jgi:putative DNA-invertase from lambdoid prophage Rac
MIAKSWIAIVVLQLRNLYSSSPAGKLMLSVLAAVAELGRDLLIERTHAWLARAKVKAKLLNGRRKLTLCNEKISLRSIAKARPPVL